MADIKQAKIKNLTGLYKNELGLHNWKEKVEGRMNLKAGEEYIHLLENNIVLKGKKNS